MNNEESNKESLEINNRKSITDYIERMIKYLPGITLICYICGYVIYKSFLLQFGIYESEILNVRYIEAGLLYLLISPFILTTHLITNKKLNYFKSIATASFAFIVFNGLVGKQDLNLLWKALIIVIGLNSYAFFIWGKYRSEKKSKLFDLTESPIFFFMLVMISLTFYSLYFKEIKTNMGGGQTYEKVLLLESKHDNIVYTDSLNRTDTLTIIYESSGFLYFREYETTKSIRKDLIIGEVSVK